MATTYMAKRLIYVTTWRTSTYDDPPRRTYYTDVIDAGDEFEIRPEGDEWDNGMRYETIITLGPSGGSEHAEIGRDYDYATAIKQPSPTEAA